MFGVYIFLASVTLYRLQGPIVFIYGATPHRQRGGGTVQTRTTRLPPHERLSTPTRPGTPQHRPDHRQRRRRRTPAGRRRSRSEGQRGSERRTRKSARSHRHSSGRFR
jgi:hypothetical protein